MKNTIHICYYYYSITPNYMAVLNALLKVKKESAPSESRACTHIIFLIL